MGGEDAITRGSRRVRGWRRRLLGLGLLLVVEVIAYPIAIITLFGEPLRPNDTLFTTLRVSSGALKDGDVVLMVAVNDARPLIRNRRSP